MSKIHRSHTPLLALLFGGFVDGHLQLGLLPIR